MKSKPWKRLFAITLVALLVGTSFAGTSLKLSATFPGWDRVRTGSLESSGSDLARDYARQLNLTCYRPEVFLRDSSTSIRSALLFYETYLPYGATERVLLDDRDQRVSVVERSIGAPVLSILVAIDSGVVMIFC